jgi:light-regulated signal transduction histidine kinase (bacteriophytochrome)/ActR/RegA family two-component response regulator/HPt (histidine-containing phosphotransfer) domain-containing protein
MESSDLTEICNRGADVCGREPIHLSGAIQPHGVLVGLDAKTMGLVTKSANAEAIFGDTPLGATPSWLPPPLIAACRELGHAGGGERTLMAGISGIGRTEAHCFTAPGAVFCEFELPAAAPGPFALDGASLVAAQAIKDMEAAKDLSGLAAIVAEAVRAVAGFDRVMVYRLEFDGDGEVAGESLAKDWDQSFMGLRFPASDIPPQARALYRVSHERWIPVRDFEPVPLEPDRTPGGDPFDLSLSLYRSISPIHQAYQQNIGADGAMSLSVLSDGTLWGLVIGHHRQPHRVSAASRHHAAAIVRAFSIMLGGRQSRLMDKRAAGLPSHAGFLSKLAVAEDCMAALTDGEPSIVNLLPGCAGAAVVWNGDGASEVRTLGETPPPGDIALLCGWIRSAAVERVFACDSISERFPLFRAHREKASGVLAILFEDARQPALLLFRPEVIRSVSWAGKPEKLAGADGNLSLPRRSFELWIEAKRDHSQAWQPAELDIAADLLSTVNYVLVHEARRLRLREAEQAALEASRAKSDFLANMSHEIRTPMNAIVGLTRMLRRDIHDPGHSEKLEKIDKSAHYLLEIVNAILDISKIEAGKLSIRRENFSLRELLGGAISQLFSLAEQKGLNLRLDTSAYIPDQLHGDSLRITQCLINYISNAVKFTPEGSVIVHVDLEKRSGVGLLLRFEVEDTGIGIEPEALKRLFLPFEQADTSITRRFGGTGLGLAITRRLAMLMGGEAGGTSTPGKGSRFWFSAIVEPAKASAVSARLNGGQASDNRGLFSGTRVLVTEDVELNREILMDMLREEGLKADIAENGEAAVTMAGANRYDLIFMDMQMPVMDGLTATRTIRRLDNYKQTPIIAVTANAFETSREECLAAGMSDFLCKPLDPDQVHDALMRVLTKDAEPISPNLHPPSVEKEAGGSGVANLRRCLSEIAGIDADSGLRRVTQPDRYVRYLRQYAEKYEGSFDRLRELLADGKKAEAAGLAHSLKGASAQLAVTGIGERAALVERAIKEETDDGAIAALLKQSEERCAVIWASIQKLNMCIGTNALSCETCTLDKAQALRAALWAELKVQGALSYRT